MHFLAMVGAHKLRTGGLHEVVARGLVHIALKRDVEPAPLRHFASGELLPCNVVDARPREDRSLGRVFTLEQSGGVDVQGVAHFDQSIEAGAGVVGCLVALDLLRLHTKSFGEIGLTHARRNPRLN